MSQINKLYEQHRNRLPEVARQALERALVKFRRSLALSTSVRSEAVREKYSHKRKTKDNQGYKWNILHDVGSVLISGATFTTDCFGLANTVARVIPAGFKFAGKVAIPLVLILAYILLFKHCHEARKSYVNAKHEAEKNEKDGSPRPDAVKRHLLRLRSKYVLLSLLKLIPAFLACGAFVYEYVLLASMGDPSATAYLIFTLVVATVHICFILSSTMVLGSLRRLAYFIEGLKVERKVNRYFELLETAKQQATEMVAHLKSYRASYMPHFQLELTSEEQAFLKQHLGFDSHVHRRTNLN